METANSGTSAQSHSIGEGRWREYRSHRLDPQLTPEQREAVERLESIGYLSGTRPGTTPAGVTVHDPDRVSPGYNLYLSGHAPEAVLMDMDGSIRHRWSRPFHEIWPDYPLSGNDPGIHFWRRAHVFENGDLLIIHEGLGMAKLDRHSNVIWETPNRAHHDLEVMPGGDIWVLSREAHVVPESGMTLPILEDFLLLLDANGLEKRRISILGCFLNSGPEHSWAEAYREFWTRSPETKGDLLREDIFHTNALRVLDAAVLENNPGFREGNILISLGNLDMIAVIDPEREAVVWSLKGRFHQQHDPRFLEQGGVMVFDNEYEPGRSRVVVFEQLSLEVSWEYSGTKDDPLYSHTCGTAHRLENGNILITESDNGRALEVTPSHEVVWEFVNPHRAGSKREFIATLFDLVRLPPEFPVEWASASAVGP